MVSFLILNHHLSKNYEFYWEHVQILDNKLSIKQLNDKENHLWNVYNIIARTHLKNNLKKQYLEV